MSVGILRHLLFPEFIKLPLSGGGEVVSHPDRKAGHRSDLGSDSQHVGSSGIVCDITVSALECAVVIGIHLTVAHRTVVAHLVVGADKSDIAEGIGCSDIEPERGDELVGVFSLRGLRTGIVM